MKKLYEKNELTFAIVWIAVYCIIQSLANTLNEKIGIEYAASAFFLCLAGSYSFRVYSEKQFIKTVWAL